MKLNNIKKIRKSKGIGQFDLALKSGISKSAIGYIEKGKKIPSQITMMKISKGLEEPTETVFNLDWKKMFSRNVQPL